MLEEVDEDDDEDDIEDADADPVRTEFPTPSPDKPFRRKLSKRKIIVICVVAYFIISIVVSYIKSLDEIPSINKSPSRPSSTSRSAVTVTTAPPETIGASRELDLSGLTLDDAAEKIAAQYADCEVDVSEGLATFTFPVRDSGMKSIDLLSMRQTVFYIFSNIAQCGDVETVFVFFDGELRGGGTAHIVYGSITGESLRSLDFSTLGARDIPNICYTWYVHPDLQ